jgi:hypothetical protein
VQQLELHAVDHVTQQGGQQHNKQRGLIEKFAPCGLLGCKTINKTHMFPYFLCVAYSSSIYSQISLINHYCFD